MGEQIHVFKGSCPDAGRISLLRFFGVGQGLSFSGGLKHVHAHRGQFLQLPQVAPRSPEQQIIAAKQALRGVFQLPVMQWVGLLYDFVRQNRPRAPAERVCLCKCEC